MSASHSSFEASSHRLLAISSHLASTSASPSRSHASKKSKKLLIANRSEIAVRISRSAALPPLSFKTVAIFPSDDSDSLHVKRCDEAILIPGTGVAAYLDVEEIIKAAKKTGAGWIHPGYGLLSESEVFARRCKEEGLVFVGPGEEQIRLFGDKLSAKRLAQECSVPTTEGTTQPTSLAEVQTFFRSLPSGSSIILKAINGGGGRGIRVVHEYDDTPEAYDRCRSEALSSFGKDRDGIYVEQYIVKARHIEVQVLGDGTGNVVHFWERECTIQRRNQKIIEFSPSPSFPPLLSSSKVRVQPLLQKIIDSAIRMATKGSLQSLSTFEFLVQPSLDKFYFMEINPRIQVEHTVTEQLLGVDLVALQLRIALGDSLRDLGFSSSGGPAFARPNRKLTIQLRVCAEKMDRDGNVIPQIGRLEVFDPPLGPDIRIDSSAYTGYSIHPSFDSLIAKLVITGSSYSDVLKKSNRMLRELRIEGVGTNVDFLLELVTTEDVKVDNLWTSWINDTFLGTLNKDGFFDDNRTRIEGKLFFEGSESEVKARDEKREDVNAPEGSVAVTALMGGILTSMDVKDGDDLAQNDQVGIIEAMKMEHVVNSPFNGKVVKVACAAGQTVLSGQAILYLAPSDSGSSRSSASEIAKVDPSHIPQSLQALYERRYFNTDKARPEAAEKRRKTGQRTAWENIEALVDKESFLEFGAFAVAAQSGRRSDEDLIKKTPADGIITGLGSINGDSFPPESARAAVAAYDFTVLAGTQGYWSHHKLDRIFTLAITHKLPFVIFCEGGGGRPGDVDAQVLEASSLHTPSFRLLASLSGLVPTIGIASGRCFAGNAALLGVCDVIIATRYSNIGMGGPAMIEGGGLGKFGPDEIGPSEVQVKNGVIDVLVENEAEAVAMARKYLSYFQGSMKTWDKQDQRILRQLIPENRVRSYDVRTVVATLVDTDSALELRPHFGVGVLTYLARIEGRPFGIVASNSLHLGGAIDVPAADKMARFLQLCDAYDLPIITLCDTPGFMVGPEAEKAGQVRHFSRIFVEAASITVPLFCIILRKGYGLGAQAMMGGDTHSPLFTVAWPSAELGPMNLEGAVNLGFKRELEAIEDEADRKQMLEVILKEVYKRAQAMNVASKLEIDAVIDPLESRSWIMRGLASCPAPAPRTARKHVVGPW